MKRFLYTLPGRFILFLVCLLSAALAVGCAAGAYWLAGSGFYTHTEKQLCEEAVYGRMHDDMYDIAELYLLGFSPDELARTYAADLTNLRFQLLDETGRLVWGNTDRAAEGWSRQYEFAAWEEDGQTAVTEYEYGDVEASAAAEAPAEASAEASEEAPDEAAASTFYVTEISGEVTGAAAYCTVRAYLEPELPVADRYRPIGKGVSLAWDLRYAVYPIGGAAALLALACCVALLRVTARRYGDEGVYPGPLSGVPFDLLLAAVALAVIAMVHWLADAYFDDYELLILLPLGLLTSGALLLGLAMTTASRVKQKNLLSNTLIWRLLRALGRLLHRLGQGVNALFGEFSVWGVVFILAALSFLELLGIGYSSDTHDVAVLWFIEKLILIPLILYLAVSLRRLQKGGQALAAGDLDYIVDTSRLIGPFRSSGDDLNSIGDGINTAVMQRLKSERLKTELITNVSHDIKTPLTSIVNYADLIGREPCDNEKITEYAAVLLRQSERLKRLIEDLVEASKAQTGNLEVELAPCDAGVFISQAGGEYEEKLRAAGLTLITSQPAGPVEIMADGRRLWRVFDNLMNNICKYSQSGTRVYLSLFQQEGQAVITFRNTSREQLNISPEELMERFVRGDSARSTEGNGLGLSIARSLTELQGGGFDVAIDGDLFKVTLTFPVLPV